MAELTRCRITTYHEVMSDLAKKAVVDKLRKEHGGETGQFREALREVSKGLLNLNWYRVILDEAHQIKNHSTRGKLLYPRLIMRLTGTQ
jgi:SNF2 family DNA or RNA helicase